MDRNKLTREVVCVYRDAAICFACHPPVGERSRKSVVQPTRQLTDGVWWIKCYRENYYYVEPTGRTIETYSYELGSQSEFS